MNDKNTDDLLRRIAQQSQPKKTNQTRNAILVLIAIVGSILLALLVFKQKEIDFDPVKTNASSGLRQKIVFNGELKQHDLKLNAAQAKRLQRVLDQTGDKFKHIQVWVEKDNPYDTLGPNTELRYQVTLVTHDGAKIKSVIHRAPQSKVVDAIAARIERDVKAYLATEPGKNPPGSFTNTN